MTDFQEDFICAPSGDINIYL